MATDTQTRASADSLGVGAETPNSGASLAFSDRVRLYLKVTTLINLCFSVVNGVIVLGGFAPEEDPTNGLRTFLIWSVTALNGMAWFAIARSRHSERTALLTESIWTLALTGAYSYVALGLDPEPARAEQVLALLLVTIILVLRASLIPAPAVATTALGVLSTACCVTFAVWYVPGLDVVYYFWLGVMAAVVVAVTTVTSYTIYGLHERMQAAKRLGQYQLDHRVGQGGMGEVYLAKHSMLQRPTAVKLLRDVTSATARDRFRQEVQTASSLTHPNTVEIYDYGRTPDGIFYFAMEYVEGASLEEIVAETGAMPPRRVARLLEQAAGSLSEAHGRGLVHRDVKPSNLMLCERGGNFDTLKVLDFGLVRDLTDVDAARETALIGTPLYLAPEAILDEAGFVPESDVYALAATGYYLLTGGPPFAGANLVEVLSDHLGSVPARPDLEDILLVDLIMRGLAKQPSQRPADAAEFLAELTRCHSFGRWTEEEARIWWAEHQAQVEAARPSFAERSRRAFSRRSISSRTH